MRTSSVIAFVFALLIGFGGTGLPDVWAEAEKPSPRSFHYRVRSAPGLSLHKDMYILPATYCEEYTGTQTEVVFQLSAKQKLYKELYFAYTQKSFWQAYDHRNSSPFRETNFNPEFFYRFLPGTIGHENLGLDVGGEHESNGQPVERSRSWNCLYLAPYYLNNETRTLLYSKLWWRVPERSKAHPDDPEGDDNPDLTDYMGYSAIHLYQAFGNRHLIHAMARGNSRHHRGAVALSYRITVPRLRAGIILSLFTGYGESLIDYNRSITRIGLGFHINS